MKKILIPAILASTAFLAGCGTMTTQTTQTPTTQPQQAMQQDDAMMKKDDMEAGVMV